jgi:uncharacterized membrane protein YgcG
MKKALFFLALFLLPLSVSAAEKIDNFDATIKINQDATINIVERISYDFGDAQKHGIFRDIQVKYNARGGNYNLRISNISVKDEFGAAYNFTTSSQGNDIQIKIGDADKLVTGKKTYIVSYRIRRAINYFDTWDELYWNVTGNGWPVAMEKVSARVILPQEIKTEDLKYDCFSGAYGSGANCTEKNVNISGVSNLSSEIFFSNSALSSSQNLTVVVGVSKGIIIKPTLLDNVLDTVMDNGILFLPFFVFIVLYYFWLVFGRDPAGRGTIIAEYSAPDNLTSSEVGTIMDGSVDKIDISSEIINLAVKGYLKIRRIEDKGIIFDSTDYVLEKLKNEGDLPNDFEQKIMSRLFRGKLEMKLSELKDVFYQDFNEIKKQIYHAVVNKGYFAKNPETIKGIYIAVGIFVAIASVGTIDIFGGLGVISFLCTAVLIFIFGRIMPSLTKKGVDARDYILGLKEYLSVAEKDRIKFHNAPEKNPQQFEKLLPYAMVLGVENEWAKQFEGIYENGQPAWYSDSTGAHFNSFGLVNNLNGFSSMASTNLVSTPSTASSGGSGFSGGGFGGGGFSGGGFGGGGGGSW